MKICWTEEALRRLSEIESYIAQGSPENAIRFVVKLVQRTKALTVFPQSGRLVPEFKTGDFRELIEGNYRIVYKIKDQLIEIYTVFEGHKLLTEKDLKK